MELGALLDVALLEQNAVAAVVLEDVGVELECRLVGLHGFFVFFPGEISRAQVGINRGGVGSVLERFLIIANGFAEALAGVVDRTEVVDGFGVIGFEADGLLVILPGAVELLHLVIGDADLVADDRVLGLILAEHVDGFAVHLTGHQNVAADLHGNSGFGGFGRHLGERQCGTETCRKREGQRSANHGGLHPLFKHTQQTAEESLLLFLFGLLRRLLCQE